MRRAAGGPSPGGENGNLEHFAPCGKAITCLDASVSVRSRGGLIGRVMAGAADGLLAAGALDSALRRIGAEATRPALAAGAHG